MNTFSKSPAPVGTQPNRLLSYFLPSMADVVFIALFVGLCYGNPRLQLLSDAGIGWHIRTGEWILQHHAVPHTDLFSNVPTRVWFAWEWLFDVVIAAIHSLAGLNGVLAFSAFLMALCFALLLRWTLRLGAPWLITLTFVALAILSSTIHALARPHLVTWLFTLVCWYVLEQKRNTTWLWLMPVLVLVWANVHGGFLVALALMGLCFTGDVLQVLSRRDRESAAPPYHFGAPAHYDLLNLASVMTASFVASLFNPYGLRLYLHIYEYLGDRFIRQHNLEMQPPNFHSIGARSFVILLVLAALIVVGNCRQLGPRQALILIFFAVAGLFSARNVPLAAMIVTMTAAPLLSRRIEDTNEASAQNRFIVAIRKFSRRMGLMETLARGHIWVIVLVSLAIVACGNSGRLFGTQIIQAGFNRERFPLRAVQFLSQGPVRGPLFTSDAWAGYVIYRQWPRLQLVIDDRHDMYGSAYMRDYLTTIRGEKDWQEKLAASGAHTVLIAQNSNLAGLLRQSPSWQMTYEDDQAVVFETR